MLDPTASLYIQLSHPQYKSLEDQLRNWEERETAHTSVDGYYHKSISFIVADIRWEFHGPNVKAAEPELEPSKRLQREANLILQASEHSARHPGSIVDCSREECVDVRAICTQARAIVSK